VTWRRLVLTLAWLVALPLVVAAADPFVLSVRGRVLARAEARAAVQASDVALRRVLGLTALPSAGDDGTPGEAGDAPVALPAERMPAERLPVRLRPVVAPLVVPQAAPAPPPAEAPPAERLSPRDMAPEPLRRQHGDMPRAPGGAAVDDPTRQEAVPGAGRPGERKAPGAPGPGSAPRPGGKAGPPHPHVIVPGVAPDGMGPRGGAHHPDGPMPGGRPPGGGPGGP